MKKNYNKNTTDSDLKICFECEQSAFPSLVEK